MVAQTVIPGNLRFLKEDSRTQRKILADNVPTLLANQSDPSLMIWVNPQPGQLAGGKISQVLRTAGVLAGNPDSDIAEDSEFIIVQELAGAATALVSANSTFQVPYLDYDMNHPEQGTYLGYYAVGDRKTTKVADNPTISATIYTDIAAFQTPSRHRRLLGGGALTVLPSST